ncbi:hypothetical protein EAO70_13400 [Streptomyces sp. adm13(2018)]|nr:hypothetical protein EAO70_13400 [Streptomyces sp. adm13(2018)]
MPAAALVAAASYFVVQLFFGRRLRRAAPLSGDALAVWPEMIGPGSPGGKPGPSSYGGTAMQHRRRVGGSEV